jgi:cytochrome c oxidase assembly factor CtaG
MLTLAVTLLSPLDRLSEQVAWAHMVQHVLLMTVAAPLLVLGSPWLVLFWGLSAPTRRALGRCWYRLGRWRSVWLLTWSPLAVWSLHMLVTWLWHAPALYEAALRRAWVHDLQHLCFLAAGCLYWRLLLDPLSRLRLIPAAGVLLLFTTTLHTMALSALMTLSPVPWYPAYAGSTELWELSHLEDQQLAGLIMWMPACLPYVAAALHLLAQSLAEPKAGDGMDRRAASWRVPEEQ